MNFILKNMKGSNFFVLHVLIFFFVIHSCRSTTVDENTNRKSFEESKSLVVVPIGVVLDLNSPLGWMVDLCMNMGVSDFYAANSNYSTRLHLQTKNADTVFNVNLAAIELLEHEHVQGIIGPQGPTEETFLAEMGQQLHVPIVSFTSKTSSLSHTEIPYFVRTTSDDAVQAQAFAALCQGFGWPEVAVLHEDSDYGNQFISHLNKAFQDAEVRLSYMISIPISADNSHILKQLKTLETKQTRVFLVHMNPNLGFRLFTLAKRAGAMNAGSAWLVTDSLSIFMNSMDSITRDSMEGVLGIRPYVPPSEDLDSFQERWKRNAVMKKPMFPIMELNVYGLWAYDAITALATALEKIAPANMTSMGATTHEITNLRISALGPKLLNELKNTKFRGLSGDFELFGEKLKPSAFEIFNIVGTGEKTIGFWTPKNGIVRDLSPISETSYSISTDLKNVMWPGDSITKPKGWAIPTSGTLRVGVPWKHGFKEFVDVFYDPKTQLTNATGFAIDIFLAALELLPFSLDHKFYQYNDTEKPDWSYDQMLHEIPKRYDMVVADTTVWAPRADYIDFSQPYTESGVVLVVKNKKPFDMWIFIRPLRWDLWLAIVVACILTGIVVRILEHRVASNGATSVNTHKDKPGMVYLSPVVVLAFPERNMVSNKWSFLVLVFWLFMAFILMQSYTANLSAILTVDQLKFAFSDSYFIGCQEGSFMKEFLMKQLHISESRLKSYPSVEKYHEAMTLGSNNGGIDAIFDEIPYMKIFLSKYDPQYKIVGPTYKAGGFGFAFPVGSPLVAHFSKAILEVTQGSNMTAIEQRNFGPGYSSEDPLSTRISQETSSLTFFDFAGLFLIIGSIIIFSLFCSETTIGRILTSKMGQFIHKLLCFRTSRVNLVDDASTDGHSVKDEGDSHEHEHAENGTVNAPAVEHVIEEVQTHGPEEVSHEIGSSDGTNIGQDLGMRIGSNGGRNC